MPRSCRASKLTGPGWLQLLQFLVCRRAINESATSKLIEVIIPLCLDLVRLHLEGCVHFWLLATRKVFT